MGKRLRPMLGFTLIEMAIVLVVMGILISGGLLAVAPVIENSKVSETNQKLDRIEQALIVHVIRNGCLPCPATGTANSGTSSDNPGQAISTSGTPNYSSGCTPSTFTCTATQGVVPWINLGLSEGDITDGWGTRISYAVDSDLTGESDMVRTPPAGYPGGDLEVQNNSNVEVTGGAGFRAAYVLISHGTNRDSGFIASLGTQITNGPSASSFEDDNSDGNPAYRQDAYNANTTGGAHFDDLVRWRSAPMIIQLCGSNACGNPS